MCVCVCAWQKVVGGGALTSAPVGIILFTAECVSANAEQCVSSQDTQRQRSRAVSAMLFQIDK